ncbi:MAG: hypothetical protein IPK88_18600 [Saprospiraceae bacterium]|nr:hypothetical protein [Candidatus Defluviibacterium haderslevense]
MSTKLTLLVEESVIEEAKLYAKKQGRSISNIVEEYLKTITATSKKSTTELHPVIKNLWGSVKVSQKNIDYNHLLQDALLEKYLK